MSEPNHKVTTVDILRHGKPEGGNIFRGTTDVDLSDIGWSQMTNAIPDKQAYQRILTSPMIRCRDFAAKMAKDQQITCQEIVDLREISFGDWDGLTFKEVEQHSPDLFKQYWTDPVKHSPPNAEPMMAFCQRVKQAFWQQVHHYQGEHLLMVVHGGVVRAILMDILQSAPVALMRFEVPYASVTRINIYHDDAASYPQLVFHNR